MSIDTLPHSSIDSATRNRQRETSIRLAITSLRQANHNNINFLGTFFYNRGLKLPILGISANLQTLLIGRGSETKTTDNSRRRTWAAEVPHHLFHSSCRTHSGVPRPRTNFLGRASNEVNSENAIHSRKSCASVFPNE